MSDSLQATEALGAKGASHPRVTLADIEAAIGREHYFTAGEAVNDSIAGVASDDPLDLFTICVLVMRNGFVQIGFSAPASPENFDREKGKTFARENAIRDLWPKMGFALRDRLSREPPADIPAELD